MSNPNNPYGSQPEPGYGPAPLEEAGPATRPLSDFQQPNYGPNAVEHTPKTQPLSAFQPPSYGPTPPSYGQNPYVQAPPQNYFMPVAPPSQRRPAGVSIIAIWHWILAGLVGLIGLLSLLAGGSLVGAGANADDLGPVLGAIGGVFLVAFVVIAVICGLFILMGLGLWRLNNGGRLLTIVIYGLNILIGLLVVSGGNAGGGTYTNLVISVAIIGYLFQPDVRSLFSAPR